MKLLLSSYSIAIFYLANTLATQHISRLPVHTFPKKTLFQQKKEYPLDLLFNPKIVLVKTGDNKLFSLPRWQMDHMPALLSLYTQQKSKGILNISKINNGINSTELSLLSATWENLKKISATSFFESLSPNEASILHEASKKIGNTILYATTLDYIETKDFKSAMVKPLIAPLTNLLQKRGYAVLESSLKFEVNHNVHFDKYAEGISPNGKKWVKLDNKNVQLYDISIYERKENFSHGNIKITPKIIKTYPGYHYHHYLFSADSKILIAAPRDSHCDLICWDINRECKEYATKVKGLVKHIALNPNANTLIFTQEDGFVETDKLPNKLYFWNFTKEGAVPELIKTIDNSSIESIIFSPNNRIFACYSTKNTLTTYHFSDSANNFIPRTVEWDNSQFITSITFNPQGTKFICLSQRPKPILCLYDLEDDYFVLRREIPLIEAEDSHTISFYPDGNSCIIGNVRFSRFVGGNHLYYWNDMNNSLSLPKHIETIKPRVSTGNISPDGKLFVFAINNENLSHFNDTLTLGYFSTDDFTHHPIPNFQPLHDFKASVRSITFSKDSKECFVISEEDRSWHPDKSLLIKQQIFNFDPKLETCTVGQATILSHAYEKLLQKTRTEIVKGTLAYELFNQIDPKLRLTTIAALGLKVIDYPENQKQSAQEQDGETELQEIQPYFAEKILATEEKKPAIHPKHLAEMEEYIDRNKKYLTEQKENEIVPEQPRSRPTTLYEKFTTILSNIRNSINSYAPAKIQNFFKKKESKSEN